MTTTGKQGWLLEEYEHLDPITFQVINNALLAICREMGVTMIRTAYSPIFVDGMDFSCGLLDETGEMIAQGNYCPVHLNSMAYSSQWALLEVGMETLRPGDVLIHNDPYRGGTHITDVNVTKPIFVDGTPIAVACDRAHQIDMGGKARGGFAGDATEIYQEGLRIPPIKWYSEGKELEEVTQLLLANVREPRVQQGDLAAQLASCLTAEQRVLDLVQKYGVETVRDAFRAAKDYSERRMRARLEAIPDGSWTFEDVMDHDGIVASPIRLHAEVTVQGDSVTVDLSGSDPQVRGPVNATFGITASMVFTALLQVSDPDLPVNHGCFRPVTIRAPRGSIVNAQFPAPTMGGNTVTAEAIYQVVAGALAQAVPTRAIAGTHVSQNLTGGGRDWVFYFFTDGGWGARHDADGWDAIFEASGNCRDYPAEVVELTLPLRCEGVRLRGDLAGVGQYRGGCGTERVFTFLQDAELNSIAERADSSPYGLAGGRPAGRNSLHVTRDGRSYTFPELTGARFPLKFSNQPVLQGDVVSVITTGGGGFGDPFLRDPTAVLRDVEDGLYTVDQAAKVYGVLLRTDPEGTLTVDVTETAALRSRRVDQRPPETGGWNQLKRSSTPTARSEEGAEADRRVQELVGLRPDAFCQSECPKRADGTRCPLWSPESLDFWSVPILERWIHSHCPQRATFGAAGAHASST